MKTVSSTTQSEEGEREDNAVTRIQHQYNYGNSLLASDFLMRPGLSNFNHGSFGTVPRTVMERHIALLQEQESCPEVWFRETYFKYVNQARERIAELIRAPLDDVVLVENASTAVNAILRSFPFHAGDVVLVFSSAYQMVTETLHFLNYHAKVETVEMPITYPVASSQHFIDLLTQYLALYEGRVKLCVFSHISSMPTIIEPVEVLTSLAKKAGAQVLVDGAHAPGILDIDVAQIGCDYYTGNCHKWLFASKGSAFLWTARRVYHPDDSLDAPDDPHPQPVVISSTGKQDYVGRFEYTGTRDYVAFCSLPSAFDFIEGRLGGIAIMREYCQTLLRQGCDYLVGEWGTSYLVPLTMCGVMANVILPSNSEEELTQLQRKLLDEYNLTMVFKKVPSIEREGQWIFYIRVSAQVYLEMKDFHILANAVKTILKLE